MTGFEGDVGHWSNVQVTAGGTGDVHVRARPAPGPTKWRSRFRDARSVTSTQRWGIPQAAPEGATVRLKGGWRPTDSGELVHQAARVDVGRESYSIAVLTDGNPSMAYGEETIRLIAAELLPD